MVPHGEDEVLHPVLKTGHAIFNNDHSYLD